MKSIIKRVIIGVLIALTLSFIRSCDVYATSKAVTYGNWKSYYINGQDTESSVNLIEATSIDFGSTPFARFSPTLNQMPSYLRGNISIDDGSAFSSYDYFSFIVLSTDAQVSSLLFYGLRSLPCSVVNNAGLLSFSETTGRMYASVVECKTSGVDNSASSSSLTIFFNQPTSITGHVYEVYLSKRVHFYNETFADELNTIINALNSVNSTLNTISTRTLNIYNLLNTDLDSIITKLETNNTKLQSILERVRFIDDHLEDFTTQNHNDNLQQHQDNVNIQSKQQETTNAVKAVDNTIKDSNVDNPTDYSNNVATNGVITQLITLPISLYTKILNSTSSSCSPFSLGTLYGTELIIPCINLSSYLGSTLYNVIDVLISGLFIYAISRKMVKVFNSLSSMKEGDVING